MNTEVRYQRAIRLMDAANAQDPNSEAVNGETRPKELLYAQRMTEMLEQYRTDASEALRLAARCQHIERWKIPRADFPSGRSGYLRWRNTLKKYHAGRAAEILGEAGYEQDTIDRVCRLIMKTGLKADAEAQALEDVICLVFLQWYLPDFARKHSDEKLVEILRKTLHKISAEARDKAQTIPLPEHCSILLDQALLHATARRQD